MLYWPRLAEQLVTSRWIDKLFEPRLPLDFKPPPEKKKCPPLTEANQEIIMQEGGISLLATTAAEADDVQTLRMVAGAIANLCGNDKLQMKLRSEGGIKALLGIVRCGHPDVLSQVARGIANFVKCESRACTQGIKNGRSFLIEDGALPWIVQNANDEDVPIRRHIELALCH
ncbi:hypothetical protein C1H46_008813 [Malus baccata]|uniref:Vacuolar protein 8 n=1 Tax=Malus baccata TaxID=106549 RepID=A0A540N3D0_MALBA|nr:hypothetical protein C1H46_008813 [Malus baccata]